jgi:hypothetical protein
VVPGLEVIHLWPDLFHNPTELVTEGLAYPRVGHHAMVKMKVGAADAASCHPYNRITRMFDPRHGLFVDADPIRPTIIHRTHLPSSRMLLGEERARTGAVAAIPRKRWTIVRSGPLLPYVRDRER